MSIRALKAKIVIVCAVGLLLSYYAYVVEITKENDQKYEAMCDISEHVSCSKAFMSEYGKGLGLIPKDNVLYAPNSVYGLITYSVFAVLSQSDRYSATIAIVGLGVIMNLTSIYLASILYLLQDICVVCVSMYIVNAILLVLAVKKHRETWLSKTSLKKTT